MPTAFVRSVAEKKGKPVAEIERIWNRAKVKAAEEGHEDEYDYITGIFKNMLGEGYRVSIEQEIISE